MKKFTEREIRDTIIDKDKNVEKITLLFASNKKQEITILLGSIMLSVESGENVPHEIIKALAALIKTEESIFLQASNERLLDLKKKVIDYYKDDNDYNFNCNLSINESKRDSPISFPGIKNHPNKKQHNLTLNDLMTYWVRCLNGKLIVLSDKNILATETYRIINDYFSLFKRHNRFTFSPYKRSVLTGYIVYLVYPTLSTDITKMKGENITNQQFHQAVKYFTTSRK